jgi:hypothetical protein
VLWKISRRLSAFAVTDNFASSTAIVTTNAHLLEISEHGQGFIRTSIACRENWDEDKLKQSGKIEQNQILPKVEPDASRIECQGLHLRTQGNPEAESYGREQNGASI